MKTSKWNIMWIDRGSKYIGLAYSQEWEKVVFPIWYIFNDKMLYFSLADIVMRHNIKKIILGLPTKQEDVQAKIQSFVEKLQMIINPDIEFDFVDEDYSSVQSWEIISNFKKNVAEDTVSAMIILDRWIASQE